MGVELALFQPEIPQNAGTLLRLGACLGTPVHIIHPAGFVLSEKRLRRAGMDYLEHVDLVEHTSFADFETWRRAARRRLVLLTTGATDTIYDHAFTSADVLLVGRESSGVPAEIAAKADCALRIPLLPGRRSLNMAIAAAMAIGEALRRTDGLYKAGKNPELM